jgi:PAS domain S-box-containing protein
MPSEREKMLAERSSTEAALIASEERFRGVAESGVVAIAFFDPSGAIWDANDAFLEMIGYTPEELRAGQVRWDLLTPPEWLQRTREAVADYQRTGRIEAYEKEYFRKDGSRFWGLFAGRRIDSTGDGVAIVLDITERKRAQEDIERLVRQRTAERDALRQQLTQVEEAERGRVARDLHDELGQELIALQLGLGEASRLASSREASGDALTSRLSHLASIADRMTASVRALALALHPPELHEGLEAALETYIHEWSHRYGIAADIATTGVRDRKIADDVCTAVYRIMQEALTNVVKHASATHVSVIVDKPDGHVNLIVEDNGHGFDVAAATARVNGERRLGMAGMRERAALVGGTVTIESSAAGTTVYVRLPG